MSGRGSIGTLLALATLVLWSLPSLAASLTYNTDYYRPPAAGATRIPRSSNAGAFVLLSSYGGPGNQITGTPFQVTLSANPTMTINSLSYNLVSATISGGVQGVAQAYPDSTGALPTHVPVWVGNDPIVVTYVYLPKGDGGGTCKTPPCATGVWIDEASDVTGGLLDDVFVEVFRPQNASNADSALTHTANYLGAVDTTSESVKIAADSDPTNPSTNKPTGSIFDRWGTPVSGLNLGPGVRDLDLASQQTGYFLAYYRHSCPRNYHFVPSPTLSACEPDNCTATQYWDAAKNQCEALTCQSGATTCPFKCPTSCGTYGCIIVPPGVPPNNKPGDSNPIYACKNARGGIGTIYQN